MEDIVHNIRVVQHRIAEACKRVGRQPSEVRLVLATKTVQAERVRSALHAGATVLGENKAQEALAKYKALEGEKAEWHFIGHLQTNKVKYALQFASLIQSIDRIEVVQKIDQRLQKEGRSIDVLLQVNTSSEPSKFGVHPDNLVALAREVARYDTVRVRGLMTIGLFSAEQEQVRTCFRLLAQLRQQLRALELSNICMDALSMGMSGDFETAIEEGATMVRVGTAIFGQRLYPDSYYWNEQMESEGR